MLNIMTTKQKAAKSETKGITRVCKRRRSVRKPAYQNGVAAPKSETHVAGLKYPSGMCMDNGKGINAFDTLFYAAIATFGSSCYWFLLKDYPRAETGSSGTSSFEGVVLQHLGRLTFLLGFAVSQFYHFRRLLEPSAA
jgi:hypothetical protein